MKPVRAKVSNLKWSQLAVLLVCITLTHVRAHELECTFVIYGEPFGYTCALLGASVSANEPVTFTGENFEGKNDSDVTYLAFYDSNVETFPNESFEKFPNLITVEVSNSFVSIIEQNSFKGATKFEKFFVRANNILRLEAETFVGASNLKEIDLSYNKLMSVHGDSFNQLAKLEKLSLERNWIAKLNATIFDDLVSLKDIYLQRNLIQIIPEGLFRNNLKLETIELQGNKIFVIFNDSFKSLNSLKEIDLRFNQCIDIHFGSEEGETALTTLNDEANKCQFKNMQEATYEICMHQLK